MTSFVLPNLIITICIGTEWVGLKLKNAYNSPRLKHFGELIVEQSRIQAENAYNRGVVARRRKLDKRGKL